MDVSAELLLKIDALEKACGQLGGLSYRMDTLEKLYQLGEGRHNDTHEKIIRFDERLKHLSDQMRLNNEAATKSINDIKAQVEKSDISTKEFIAKTATEIQQGQDRIITCLGIDESPDSFSSLRESLKHLQNSYKDNRELTLWVKRGVITLILGGFATALYTGIKTMIVSVPHT